MRASEPGRSLRALVPLTAVLFASDWAYRQVGDSFFPGGPLDEAAHLATAFVLLMALPRRLSHRLWWPAVLVASVAIDLDHIPGYLGDDFLTRGTPRPYTHSLTTVLAVIVMAILWRRRRRLLVSIAVGLCIHFFRDAAEGNGSGIALIWPASDRAFSYSHTLYVGIMAGIAVVAARGLWNRCPAQPSRSQGDQQSYTMSGRAVDTKLR